MASVFRKDDQVSAHPKRNVFDMSFQNNFTTKFGQLLPVFCQEVLPGDSFKIDPAFALRYMPQKFPVQTRQRAHLHFFYCRNRAVWDGWMDFIGRTKDGLVPPYVKMDGLNRHNYLTEGSLGDMFGLPTMLYYNEGVDRTLYSTPATSLPTKLNETGYFNFATGQFEVVEFKTIFNLKDSKCYVYTEDMAAGFLYRPATGNDAIVNSGDVFNPYVFKFPEPLNYDDRVSVLIPLLFKGTSTSNYINVICEYQLGDKTYFGLQRVNCKASTSFVPINSNNRTTISAVPTLYKVDGTSLGQGRLVRIHGWIADATSNNQSQYEIAAGFSLSNNSPQKLINLLPETLPFEYVNGNIGTTTRINVMPWRHYESIYNSFYRNAENNPYMLNGVAEYNKYVPTTAGGADINHYSIRYRNWEDDFLTTALPTPQQGNAPRVGITGTQNALVTIANEDGTKTQLTLQADGDGLVHVVNAPGTTSSEEIRPFVEMVNYGITINDFRNVNSLQRWLENNIRKGYKYRDQIKAHYGVSVRYDELLMPEFIGGVSRDVNVTQITSTTENEDVKLGDIAGQSYVMGEGKSIHHYCDEHGYIIGILSVVPSANYSQMIPKHLLKTETFDYYFPEFGKIGYQPVANKEVAFMQSWLDNNLNEAFGYQRPWYDYLANVDQVHGLFRSDLKSFILSRVFGKSPELGSQFTTVLPDSVNNTFYSDDDKDKIIGQIYFKVSAKREIPEYGIPSLE